MLAICVGDILLIREEVELEIRLPLDGSVLGLCDEVVLLVRVEPELDIRLFVDGLVLEFCNKFVLLMVVKDEPAVDKICIMLAVLELGDRPVVLFPRILKFMGMVELDCLLELVLEGPLLDPVDGPETSVGVVHLDVGAYAVRIVGRRDLWFGVRVSHTA